MNFLTARELVLLNFAADDLRVVRLVLGGFALLAAFVAFVSAAGLPPRGTQNVFGETGGRSDLARKIAAALACVPLIGGIIFFRARDSFVRFYAIQSLIFGAAWLLFDTLSSIMHGILWAIPDLGHLLAGLWALVSALAQMGFLMVLIIAIVKAFSGVRWDIPWIGSMARKRVDRV